MDNINLIHKIAWSFHRTTGLDRDDLFQEAAVAYLKAIKEYDPTRGNITTFVWWRMRDHLRTYLRKERKRTTPLCSTEDVDIDHPLRNSYLFELLTEDAQQIANIVLSTPEKFTPRSQISAYQRLIRVLQRRGWSKPRVWRGIFELNSVFTSA